MFIVGVLIFIAYIIFLYHPEIFCINECRKNIIYTDECEKICKEEWMAKPPRDENKINSYYFDGLTSRYRSPTLQAFYISRNGDKTSSKYLRVKKSFMRSVYSYLPNIEEYNWYIPVLMPFIFEIKNTFEDNKYLYNDVNEKVNISIKYEMLKYILYDENTYIYLDVCDKYYFKTEKYHFRNMTYMTIPYFGVIQ